jgi:hypothetical protein
MEVAAVTWEELAEVGAEIKRLRAEKLEIERRLAEMERRQRALIEELNRRERKFRLTPEGWKPVFVGTMIGADENQRLTASLFEAAIARGNLEVARDVLELAVLNGTAEMWRSKDGLSMHAVLACMEKGGDGGA